MSEISLNIQEPYKTFIIKGKKTVEGRLNKGKFSKIKEGDILNLDSVKLKVLNKNTYTSFKKMIEEEGIKNVTPDKKNIKEAVNVYYKFYTQEQEKNFGVVAIKIIKL